MNQPTLKIVIYGFGTERFYVHSVTTDKVFYFAFNLWGASRIVGAIRCSFACIPDQRRTAFGTARDELDFFAEKYGAGLLVDSNNLGNNLACLFNVNHVAAVEVKLLHNVGVVKRSALHNGACQQNRFHLSHRCDSSGASYLINNVVKSGTCALSLKFVGNSPARRFGCIAQLLLLSQGVHF